MDLANIIQWILVTPLVGAGLIWIFGRRNGNMGMALSLLSAAIILVGSGVLLLNAWDGEAFLVTYPWLSLGALHLEMGFYLNRLSALMLFVVSFVGFWIHVFSVGYMKDDDGKGRFFGGLSIFMFSMLGIVLAENLFMMFVFWELVGFSSYMLIGHYLTQDDARMASKKAFIVNRVGDFGFLIGIILVYWTFGTTSLPQLAEIALEDPALSSTVIGLLLFCGVVGKSAQMPLHVWLPDAMAGPTPISALIHAATMVAAGVYFLGRTYFLYTPEALTVVTWIGVATAVCAAIWAFAQRDIKKILAYSTLSQLGYMVAAFGMGTLYGLAHGDSAHAALYGVGASMFHLTTHAFFKALLFLGSGSVIHACHHEQDIFKMGGLLRKMPVTGITFLAGVIAIAGVPYIGAGFFSKDAILYIAKMEMAVPFYLLVATALLTAMYMGRLFTVAFLGKPNSESAEHAKESPWTMTLPLVVLGIFSIGGGYAVLYPEVLREVMNNWVPHPHGADHTLMIGISGVASIGGLLLALGIYGMGSREDRLEKSAYPLYVFSRSRFYFDELYNAYIGKIQDRGAEILAFLDTFLIGGLAVRGSAGITGLFGILARASHTGNTGAYVWWFFAGLALFGAYAAGIIEKLFGS